MSISEFKAMKAQGRVGKRRGDTAKREMYQWLRDTGLIVVCEFKFSARKYKFDFAIPSIRLAVEYEGLGFRRDKKVDKSGHTTVTGYTSNCSKYNLAVVLGWRVLRYTALNYKNLKSDLKAVIYKGPESHG